MQYLEHALFGLALVIFLGVAVVVGLAVVIKLVRGARPKAPAATIYPIPPSERGTGRHVSLLDLVDDHISAEDLRRRRQTISDKLYDWTRGGSDPKS